MTLIYKDDKDKCAAALGWPEGYLQAISDLYLVEDLSYSQVAGLVGSSKYAIQYRMGQIPGFQPKPRGGNQSKQSRMNGGQCKKYPLPEYPAGTKLKKITCCVCGIVFERPARSRAIRCQPCQKTFDQEANRLASKARRKDSGMNETEYECSLAEIAEEEGISRERVRQIQEASLRKLEKFQHLREFLR